MSITVEMTWDEIRFAVRMAADRVINGLRNRRREYYGAKKDIWFDFIGCLGEMAVAKHFNLYWQATEFGVIDVGKRYQVRSTSKHGNRLCLHDEDADNLPFILVYVIEEELPLVTLRGWLWGHEGKQQQWFHTIGEDRPDGASYWVPPEKTRDMEELEVKCAVCDAISALGGG